MDDFELLLGWASKTLIAEEQTPTVPTAWGFDWWYTLFRNEDGRQSYILVRWTVFTVMLRPESSI